MTLDEAALILNVKKDTPLEQVLKVCSPFFTPPNPFVQILHHATELRTPVQGKLGPSKSRKTRQSSTGQSWRTPTLALSPIQSLPSKGKMGSGAQDWYTAS